MNHQNNYSFYRYHIRNLPYVKNLEGFFFRLYFPLSNKVYYFSFLLGLTVSPISYFLITEISVVFFLLFLQGIQKLSGVTLAKSSPCPDKP